MLPIGVRMHAERRSTILFLFGRAQLRSLLFFLQ
jgi:hypothetical protein